MLTKDDIRGIGFREIGQFTVADNMVYDLGRNRQLSLSCVGTPNEMLFICELDTSETGNINISDLVCLHNYDYDGYLSLDKLKTLISAIGTNTHATG